MLWKLAERVGAQAVTLLVSILLARLLTPEDYSIVGIVTVFFAFCNVFVVGGFNMALIQKKDADGKDYSSVLIVSALIAAVLYVALFFLAPWISSVYGQPLLIPVFRVMGMTLIIDAVKAVLYAFVSNQLQFKKFFFSTLCGTCLSAVVGIGMAYAGYGPWALVAQKMVSSVVDTLILLVTSRIRLQFKVSFDRLKGLFSYGWKIFVASIISTVYDQTNPLIIGLRFSGADLSYYTKGRSFPMALNTALDGAMTSVLFPAMSKVQDDPKAVLSYTRKFISTASYVIFPVMVGFLAVSDNFVRVLLTEKWMGASIYIQIFCITFMFNIIQNGNLQTIRAIGRSDIILKLEIIKKSLYFLVIGLTVIFARDPVILALATVVNTGIATVVNTAPNRKLIGYRYRAQLWDIAPNLLIAGVMGVAVYFMSGLPLHPALVLVIQCAAGAVIYVLLSVITRNKNFDYLLGLCKQYIFKKR